METYSFRPKDWLSTVLEAFVYLCAHTTPHLKGLGFRV